MQSEMPTQDVHSVVDLVMDVIGRDDLCALNCRVADTYVLKNVSYTSTAPGKGWFAKCRVPKDVREDYATRFVEYVFDDTVREATIYVEDQHIELKIEFIDGEVQTFMHNFLDLSDDDEPAQLVDLTMYEAHP